MHRRRIVRRCTHSQRSRIDAASVQFVRISRLRSGRAGAGLKPLSSTAAPTPQARWHARWLLAAPHRLPFFAGTLLIAAGSAWWLAVLLAALLARPVPPHTLPVTAMHGLLMVFGFMPMFFAGFQFTAVPKWLGVKAVAPRSLALPVAVWLTGWVLFAVGSYLSQSLAAGGVAVAAGGWSMLCWRFAGLLHSSTRPDRSHARVMAWADAFGAIGLWLCAVALMAGRVDIVRLSTQVGLWAFVAPVFAAAAHRMLPFFDSGSRIEHRWPAALLWALVALLLAHAASDIAAWRFGALPGAVRWAQATLEALVAAGLGALALRWLWQADLRRRLAHRMNAMLFVGFVWLVLALALAALQHGLMAAGAGTLPLGRAPLHALGMGFMGSVVLTMVGRISAAHSGRAVAADDFLWWLFWLLQLAVLLRLLAVAWPALTVAAALAWSVAVLPWALRLAGWYGRARADGRRG